MPAPASSASASTTRRRKVPKLRRTPRAAFSCQSTNLRTAARRSRASAVTATTTPLCTAWAGARHGRGRALQDCETVARLANPASVAGLHFRPLQVSQEPLPDLQRPARLRDRCESCRRPQGLAVRRRGGGALARHWRGSCRPVPSATALRARRYSSSGTRMMSASATRTQTEGTRSQCHKGDRPSRGVRVGRLGYAEQRARVGDRGRTWQCLEPGEVRVVQREPLQVVCGGCETKGQAGTVTLQPALWSKARLTCSAAQRSAAQCSAVQLSSATRGPVPAATAAVILSRSGSSSRLSRVAAKRTAEHSTAQ